MEITERIKKLGLELTKEQKLTILDMCNECRNRGAQSNTLAPFYSLIYINWDAVVTEDDIITVERLEKQSF